MRTQLRSSRSPQARGGFFIAEALMAITVFALIAGTVLVGYVTAGRQMAWASNSAAAQAMAVSSLEQAFGAKWSATGTLDEMSTLALTQSGSLGQGLKATNYMTITAVSTNAPMMRFVSVNCVWSFQGKLFTNTVAALRGPNY